MSRSLFVKIAGMRPLPVACLQAVWARWMFLRVQTECPLSLRQMPREKMDEDSALEPPRAIGLEQGHLVIKLHRREHMAEGSILVGKCTRHKCPWGMFGIHAPHLFCPLCLFWENAHPSAYWGGIFLRDYRAQLFGRDQKCGEAVRMVLGRSSRNAQYQKRAGQVDFGSWRKFRATA